MEKFPLYEDTVQRLLLLSVFLVKRRFFLAFIWTVVVVVTIFLGGAWQVIVVDFPLNVFKLSVFFGPRWVKTSKTTMNTQTWFAFNANLLLVFEGRKFPLISDYIVIIITVISYLCNVYYQSINVIGYHEFFSLYLASQFSPTIMMINKVIAQTKLIFFWDVRHISSISFYLFCTTIHGMIRQLFDCFVL